MVKLLHAADLHLDSAFSALPPEKAAQRRAEQRLVLERLTALSEGCAAVLLAGDLFDSARVYRDTLEALRPRWRPAAAPFLSRLATTMLCCPARRTWKTVGPKTSISSAQRSRSASACRSSTSTARASCARRCPPCWTASAPRTLRV